MIFQHAGFRKSLLNVFKDGICHPKMAMVIDDRLKVWEDKDQLRVHVVPPFIPYCAPQAEVGSGCLFFYLHSTKHWSIMQSDCHCTK